MTGVNTALKESFADAGRSLFDSMVSETAGVYYEPATPGGPDGSDPGLGPRHSARMFWSEWERRSSDLSDVQPNDLKVIVLQEELNIEPATDGFVEIDGALWRVVDKSQDPANVTWTLQCRRR